MSNIPSTIRCLSCGSSLHVLLVVVQLVQVEFVPAGKILLREGATPDQLVVVRQGAVQVSGGALPGVQDSGIE